MVNQFQYDRLTGLYSRSFSTGRPRTCWHRIPKKRYDVICSDIENFKLINDVFGIPAGDRLLCGIARLYTRLVNGRGLCGRFNADQFVCLEHGWEYPTMFRNAEIEISAMSNTRSVSLKWGVFAVVDRTIPLSRCATGRFWPPAASRDSTESISPPMTISCATSCCGSRPSRTAWRLR